jgi:hypothetical protein
MRDGYIAKHRSSQAERMPSSRNANPRYLVGFDDVTYFPTAPDAAVAYRINNPENYGDVQILLNGRRQIVDLRPMEEGK